MLAIRPDNLVGGLAGIALLAALCGLVGRAVVGHLSRLSGLDWAERVGLALLTGYALLSWIGSVLALGSVFSWRTVLAVTGATLWLTRGSWRLPSVVPGWPRSKTHGALTLCLFLAVAWLFAHPAETFLLFDDSAVYAISGIHLAREGTLVPDVVPNVCTTGQVFRYFGPFRWWDSCSSSLSVGFLPVPKVWAAFAAWLFGAGGAIWCAPFAALLGVFSLFLFLRRMLGRGVSLLATALAAASFPVLWYGRILMSETFTMVALFGGAFLLAVERKGNDSDRPTSLGLIAAMLIGVLALTRIEAIFIVLVLVVAWVLSQWQRRRSSGEAGLSPWTTRWLLMLSASCLAGTSASFLSSPHYFVDTLVKVLSRDTLRLAVLSGAAFTALLVVLRNRKASLRQLGMLGLARIDRVYLGSVVLIVLAALVAAVAGVSSATGTSVTQWLASYIGIPLAVIGLVGILALALRQPQPEMYALLAVSTAFLLVYTVRPLVNLVHPWAIRRVVPFILPTLLAGAGYVFGGLWHAGRNVLRHSRIGQGLLILALTASTAAAAWPLARVSLPFLNYRETAGVWEQLVQLDSLYPQNALLIYDNGPYGIRIPQVMELAFGREVISLTESPGDESLDRLERAIEDGLAAGRRVFYSAVDGDISWDSERYSLRSFDSHLVKAPRVTYQDTPPPAASSIATMQFLVDIYEVVPAGQANVAGHGEFQVPLGEGSLPYLVDGFYGLESDGVGIPYRWTAGDARIVIPLPPGPLQASRAQSWIDIAAWRPEGAESAEVTVTVTGLPSSVVTPDGGFTPQRFEFDIPGAALAGRTEMQITIHCNAWTPSDHGMDDARSLGVAFFGGGVRLVEDSGN
jgi:hypothetical protein